MNSFELDKGRIQEYWIMTIRFYQLFIVVTSVSDPTVTKIESCINW